MTLVGQPLLSGCLASLIYSSKEVGGTRIRIPQSYHLRRPTSFVPLLYHNLGGLSRGFLHFLRIFFESTYACATLTMASIHLRLPSPLDTNSIPQTAHKVNR